MFKVVMRPLGPVLTIAAVNAIFFSYVAVVGYCPYLFSHSLTVASPHAEDTSGYFFKRFVISNGGIGFLTVGAPDRFTIYLNGKKIGSSQRLGDVASGTFFLSGLKEGENLLAVVVRRKSMGPVWLKAQGVVWIDGVEKMLATDGTWIYRNLPPQAVNGVSWEKESLFDGEPPLITDKLGPDSMDVPFPPPPFPAPQRFEARDGIWAKAVALVRRRPMEKLFLFLQGRAGFEIRANGRLVAVLAPTTSVQTAIVDLSPALFPVISNKIEIGALSSDGAEMVAMLYKGGRSLPLRPCPGTVSAQTVTYRNPASLTFVECDMGPPVLVAVGICVLAVWTVFLFWMKSDSFSLLMGLMAEMALLTLLVAYHCFAFYSFYSILGLSMLFFALIFIVSYYGRRWRIYPSFDAGWIVAIFLAGFGVGLRLYIAFNTSLSVDERSLLGYANGILSHGYPLKKLGLVDYPLFTYELSSFIISLPLLFKLPDQYIRIPAVIASFGTMILLYKMAKEWWGTRPALSALLFYVLLPVSVKLGDYSFHVQFDQFFYLLTGYLFLSRLIPDSSSMKNGFYAALACSALYLSWEGSIFVFPLLCIIFVLLCGGKRIFDYGFLVFIFVTGGIIFFQLALRTRFTYPHLLNGLSTFFFTPTLAFLHPQYNAWFIFDNYFFTKGVPIILIFSAFFYILGKRHEKTLPILLFYIGPPLCIQLFLLHPISHYFYFVLPWGLLACARGFELLCNRLKGSASLAGVISLAILLGAWPLKTAVGRLPDDIQVHNRPEFFWVEYGGMERFLSVVSPNATIVTTAPHIVPKGRGSTPLYFFRPGPLVTVLYDPVGSRVFFVDKFAGKPSIDSVSDLDSIIAWSKTVCFVVFNEDLWEKLGMTQMNAYLQNNFHMLQEQGNVALYCRGTW